MLLVDTSVWIDHLHRSDPVLVEALEQSSVVHHPMVHGEISMGALRDRATVLALLAALPSVAVATDVEVLRMVEAHSLFGRGLGWVDAHLLASVLLTPEVSLWTRDRRLREAAQTFERAAP